MTVRPPLVDVLLATSMAGYALYDVVGAHSWNGSTAVNAVAVTGMTLSLAFRRRFPVAVLAIVGCTIVGLGVAYGSSQAWSSVFPFVVATYSAAAYAPRVWPVAVLALGTSVLRDVYDPYVHSVNDALFSSTLALLTFLAGVEGRRLHVRANRLDDRAAQLEMEEEQLAAAAAEAERRRIARELHDIISHGLGVMVLQAGAAEQVIASDPERARGALAAVRRTGQEAIGELSTLLGLMREGASQSREPNPTVADVAQLVARAQAGGMSVRMHLDVGDVRFSPALELSVYRIVQEALTNASKHAIGAQVEVNVTADDSSVRISVIDDGVVPAGAPGGRRGLAGMAERVAVFGGTWSAGPRNGGGWVFEAVLPVRR